MLVLTTPIPYADFAATLNSTYTVVLTGSPSVDLTLVEAGPLKERGPFESFTLLFEAAEGERLAQKAYTVKHRELGEQEIFLVPVVPEKVVDRNLRYYEAAFSRKKDPNDIPVSCAPLTSR